MEFKLELIKQIRDVLEYVHTSLQNKGYSVKNVTFSPKAKYDAPIDDKVSLAMTVFADKSYVNVNFDFSEETESLDEVVELISWEIEKSKKRRNNE